MKEMLLLLQPQITTEGQEKDMFTRVHSAIDKITGRWLMGSYQAVCQATFVLVHIYLFKVIIFLLASCFVGCCFSAVRGPLWTIITAFNAIMGSAVPALGYSPLYKKRVFQISAPAISSDLEFK